MADENKDVQITTNDIITIEQKELDVLIQEFNLAIETKDENTSLKNIKIALDNIKNNIVDVLTKNKQKFEKSGQEWTYDKLRDDTSKIIDNAIFNEKFAEKIKGFVEPQTNAINHLDELNEIVNIVNKIISLISFDAANQYYLDITDCFKKIQTLSKNRDAIEEQKESITNEKQPSLFPPKSTENPAQSDKKKVDEPITFGRDDQFIAASLDYTPLVEQKIECKCEDIIRTSQNTMNTFDKSNRNYSIILDYFICINKILDTLNKNNDEEIRTIGYYFSLVIDVAKIFNNSESTIAPGGLNFDKKIDLIVNYFKILTFIFLSNNYECEFFDDTIFKNTIEKISKFILNIRDKISNIPEKDENKEKKVGTYEAQLSALETNAYDFYIDYKKKKLTIPVVSKLLNEHFLKRIESSHSPIPFFFISFISLIFIVSVFIISFISSLKPYNIPSIFTPNQINTLQYNHSSSVLSICFFVYIVLSILAIYYYRNYNDKLITLIKICIGSSLIIMCFFIAYHSIISPSHRSSVFKNIRGQSNIYQNRIIQNPNSLVFDKVLQISPYKTGEKMNVNYLSSGSNTIDKAKTVNKLYINNGTDLYLLSFS